MSEAVLNSTLYELTEESSAEKPQVDQQSAVIKPKEPQGAAKPAVAADKLTAKIVKKQETTNNVLPAGTPIQAAFDPGQRSLPPSKYQQAVKTVPNPVEEFVVEEKQEDKKSQIGTASNVGMNLRRGLDKFSAPKPLKVPDPSRLFYKDLKVVPLPSGTFHAVFLTGDQATKTFAMYEFTERIKGFRETVDKKVAEQAAQDSSTSYKPLNDEIVLAKYEDLYYRAVCLDSTDEGYSVRYIDYGDLADVKESDIKPAGQLKFDVLVHSVFLENFPDSITEHAAAVLGGEYIAVEGAEWNAKKNIWTARIADL